MSGPEVDRMGDEPGIEDAADPAEPGERQRLYLHIGVPKSGSTFLQSVLGGNREALKAHGYVYPYVRQEGMFHAALEMAGNPEQWGLTHDEVQGTFAHLLRRGRRLGGTVVISHEIFGAATAQQVAAIGEQLDDFDVHVVVTVRNIGRTITAQWQERVKNGINESFEEFSTDLLDSLPSSLDGPMVGFWRGQNLAWLLDRWRPLVPPERTHLVVTPSGGTGPEVLWRRFAEATGIPVDVVDLSQVPPGNESLGVPQIAFLRQVLTALDGRLEQPWHSMVAKRWFAQTLLSKVRGPKPVTPAPVADCLTEVTRAWIELVRSGGYQVHGDLDELLPEPTPPGSPHPDEATPAEMLDGLPGVVAEMLLRTRDLRVTVEALEAEKQALTEERDRLAAQVTQQTEDAERRRRWRPF